MFIALLPKIIPLYFLIALGFIGGRYLKLSAKSIADLVIYIIAPVVFFGYVAQVEFSVARAMLPALTFLIPLTLILTWLYLGRFVFQDNRRQLAAFTAGCGNTGYYGVPAFIAMFDTPNLGLYTLAIVGYMFYECGPGYFILARGKHGIRESLRRALSLPALYAAILGVIYSLCGGKLSTDVKDIFIQFKGAYVVLGMMLIGLALSNLKSLALDLKFICFVFLGKLIAMPLLALLTILVITKIFKLNDPAIIQVLATYSCVPIAANLTAYTTQLELHPEKAAATVFISTALSLVHMPLVVPWLLSWGSS